MNERVEAAAKELHRYVCEEYDYGPWEKQSEDAKQLARESVSRILKAADAVEGERVVWRNDTGEHQPSDKIPVFAMFWVFDNEELVVRKRRGG